jgi:hypothetical protein
MRVATNNVTPRQRPAPRTPARLRGEAWPRGILFVIIAGMIVGGLTAVLLVTPPDARPLGCPVRASMPWVNAVAEASPQEQAEPGSDPWRAAALDELLGMVMREQELVKRPHDARQAAALADLRQHRMELFERIAAHENNKSK